MQNSGGFDLRPVAYGWLVELLNGVEHANFFETRATEYSKGASQGSWTDTWAAFDRQIAA